MSVFKNSILVTHVGLLKWLGLFHFSPCVDRIQLSTGHNRRNIHSRFICYCDATGTRNTWLFPTPLIQNSVLHLNNTTTSKRCSNCEVSKHHPEKALSATCSAPLRRFTAPRSSKQSYLQGLSHLNNCSHSNNTYPKSVPFCVTWIIQPSQASMYSGTHPLIQLDVFHISLMKDLRFRTTGFLVYLTMGRMLCANI